jgi:hypothetical protein
MATAERQPLGRLWRALQGSLAAAIETCTSQESQESSVVVELRTSVLGLLDTCSDASQGGAEDSCFARMHAPVVSCMAITDPSTYPPRTMPHPPRSRQAQGHSHNPGRDGDGARQAAACVRRRQRGAARAPPAAGAARRVREPPVRLAGGRWGGAGRVRASPRIPC